MISSYRKTQRLILSNSTPKGQAIASAYTHGGRTQKDLIKLNDINHSMAVASSKIIGFWEGLRILANGLISERFSNQKR